MSFQASLLKLQILGSLLQIVNLVLSLTTQLHCYFSRFRAMADSAEASAASEAPVQAEEDGFVVVQSASALPSTGIVTRTQFLSCLLEYSYQQMVS